MPDKFRQQFSEMLSRTEEDVALAEAALYIAGEEYPDLDVPGHLNRLDKLGKEAEQYIGTQDIPRSVLQRLSEFLFIRHGFQGNREDYYDRENSYLNRVLERKLGIPITIGIVYMEVALRLGLVLEGIALPGHFVLRYGPPEWELYVDPFNEGRLLDKAGCEQIVHNMFHERTEFREEFLLPYTKKQILVRLLTNLKGVSNYHGDYERAIAAADRIDIIEPGMGSNLKERAALNCQLKRYRLAIKDLELYIKRSPEPEDAEDVKRQIKGLWHIIATIN